MKDMVCKNIIIFTPTLNIGGIERVLLTYAKGLADKNYNVTYLTSVNKTVIESPVYEKVKFICMGTKRLRYSLFKMASYLKKVKPDIIITANDATLIVYLAKLLSCCRLRIITSHHNYYFSKKNLGLRHELIVKYIYPLCNNVIAVSDGIFSFLHKESSLSNRKIITIYNPIDVELVMRLSEEYRMIDKNYILFVGRFTSVKNIPLLFSSFQIFNKVHPEVKLILIGSGEEENNIRKIVEKLCLSNLIDVKGEKSNPFPYIKNAAVIALSSMSEALPTILIESLLLGKSIVSTPTNGAIDILRNGKFGYISNSITDIDDFAKKMILAYEKPLNKKILINEAKNRYDLEKKILELERIWK